MSWLMWQAQSLSAAWFCAVAVPMQLLLDPNLENARKPVFLLCGSLALSGYLGSRARRTRQEGGFFLMAIVPLVLLCGSTTVALFVRG